MDAYQADSSEDLETEYAQYLKELALKAWADTQEN